jgi:hypothetical protein
MAVQIPRHEAILSNAGWAVLCAAADLRPVFTDPAHQTPLWAASKAAAQELCRVGVRHGLARVEDGAWRVEAPSWQSVPPMALEELAAATRALSQATPRALRAVWRARGVGEAADGLARVEGVAKEQARAAMPDVGRAAPLMDMKATMYFTYGADKRPEVQSTSTFDAILRGERSSTTRFDVWPGAEQWARLEPGALVRFYADKDKTGRFVDVSVSSTHRVDLGRFNAAQMEAWSKAEGWSVEHGRQIGRRGPATQIRYAPLEGEVERLMGPRLRAAQDRDR